jgi:hypothetical protein
MRHPLPDPAERAIVAREQTMARLVNQFGRVAAQLSDDEVLRLVQAMISARARARGEDANAAEKLA